jgi:hypothetical protein
VEITTIPSKAAEGDMTMPEEVTPELKQRKKQLSTPLILGTDAIPHMSIKYLSTSESFMFQEDIIGENKFRKADIMTVQKLIIQAQTCVPVRLGTASGRRHTPMAAGIKSVTKMENPDYPALFSQPGSVVPNHQGDVTIVL